MSSRPASTISTALATSDFSSSAFFRAADLLSLQQFTDHRIEVVRDFERLGLINADKSRITQILTNLLVNAIDAISETAGSGTVAVSIRADGPDRMILSVTDDGIGIDPQNLSGIFSHGFTTKVAGHGFGLHHSANSAAEMGGSLAASSEGCGRGASFRLSLPLDRARGACDAPSSEPVAGDEPALG